MPAEETRALYRAVEAFDPDTGAVALGEPFACVRDGVVLMRDGAALGRDEANRMVRCAAGGEPVIPMAAPMHIQLGALSAYGELHDGSVDGHLADLAAVRASIRDLPVDGMGAMLQAEAHLYDAMSANPSDPVLPQRLMANVAAEDIEKPPTVDPVIRKIQEDTRIEETAWTRVVDLPQHRVEQLRAMAREMLRPVLGNSAHLEDLRVLPMGRDEIERANAVRRWIRESGDVRDLPPFTTPAMPGYRTTEPMLAERDGVTLLMFSDFGGSYAYAWQTDPDTAPKIHMDAEERPYPFNMLP